MNTLPDIIRKNGFTYTLILRDDRKAIYQQQVDEKLQYFEIIKIKVKPPSIFKGVSYPEREVFPSDEDFGKTAWSCRTLADAMVRFNSLA